MQKDPRDYQAVNEPVHLGSHQLVHNVGELLYFFMGKRWGMNTTLLP